MQNLIFEKFSLLDFSRKIIHQKVSDINKANKHNNLLNFSAFSEWYSTSGEVNSEYSLSQHLDLGMVQGIFRVNTKDINNSN